MKYCTFIRGVLAHPRRYTFDHGWERAELRASLTVHVSQKTVYLRPAPPLTVVAPCCRCRSARRCSPSPGAPPPCLLSPDCPREIRPGAVSRNAEMTVPSSGRPLRAVEELLRRRAQLSRDPNTAREGTSILLRPESWFLKSILQNDFVCSKYLL